ncbi:hypothetical protein HHK36_024361 [Tetracentron sinense]|uniref:Uncharacterized protein n=1 Tax=Tetracentron sinense TaxID=13715 RepID=A0A834YPM7_TETSI|nr:hypothetical protein HHK36_024361 [Tetracentron sinense]
MNKQPCNPQEAEVRKGPWTMEEDLILINYITNHGDGVWNTVARSAGLKRTGKSCRLRWLNYLRPDVRRGNITAEEQLLIMDLHARFGNSQSSEPTNIASTSQMCGAGEGIQPYSPTDTGNINALPPEPLPTDANDNSWSMEDLWPMEETNFY